jgi:hypothetical protein
MEQERIEKCGVSPAFDLNWKHVKSWSEESRYDTTKGEQEAQDLVRAISDNQQGVLPWIKPHW